MENGERPKPSDVPVVLVVDDDAPMRSLVREALTGKGFEVLEAEEGESALELFDRSRVDFVLLDVIMPGMDGFDTCARMRSRPGGAHVPIVMMTGLDDIESIRRAYEAGATDFVTKPINSVILEHRLRYMKRAKDTLDELRSSRRRLANAQRIARLGTWEWHCESDRFRMSEETSRMFGIDRADPPGTTGSCQAMLERVHPDERERIVRIFAKARADHDSFSFEHRVVMPNGSVHIFHQEAESTSEALSDEAFFIGTVQDITERRNAEDKIFLLANYDNLTNLPNRILLREHLRQALEQARRYRRALAVLSIGLDSFKRINDTLGHTAGDELLRQVGERLRGCFRDSDFFSRSVADDADTESEVTNSGTLGHLGGDEFMVLLTEIRRFEDAALVAERVAEAMSDPLELDGNEIRVTASVGITLFPDNGEDVETLLKNADVAMHHAKDRGKNNYQFYSESLNARALERLALENSLRVAVERQDFHLHYQPQVNVITGEVTGVEALLRWQHPRFGNIPPAEFVPLAEDTGLIVPLGEWVLKTACAQARAWQQEGLPPLKMAVNISGKQFAETKLTEVIRGALDDSGLEPGYLEIEITEGVLMEDIELGTQVLAEIKRMGMDIALDDFGTGYSSLSYLKKLPIDAVKIDRSFVGDLTGDSDSASIVAAIIALTQSMRIEVIAEGVETAEQLAYLRQRGCALIQGYYFSRPLSPADLAAWYRSFLAEAEEAATG